MGYEDLRIRDVSRLPNEWTPPVGVLGGPPAAVLYRELVVYAEMRLFQDGGARPCVVLRDGSHPRAFSVPSAELRTAIDRFRMRRNLRPVPEADIEEFARIVEARVSDPDVQIPPLEGQHVDTTGTLGQSVRSIRAVEDTPLFPSGRVLVAESAPTGLLVGAERAPGPPSHGRSPTEGPAGHAREWTSANPAVSGGHLLSGRDSEQFSRYVRVLRTLVRDGDWMGTTRQLSELTRDEPLTVYEALMRFRGELAENDLVIAHVEIGDSYRWLAVDRAKLERLREVAAVQPTVLPAE